MDYRERQQNQFVRISGLQKLTQKFGLCLHLEMIDVRSCFRINRIKTCELCPCTIIYKSVADLWNPLWAATSTKKVLLMIGYDVRIDRLSGTPSLSTKLRKLLLRLTFSRKFVQKQIDLTGRSDSSSQNDWNGRGFTSKWAWLQKFRTIGIPLLQILGPPL